MSVKYESKPMEIIKEGDLIDIPEIDIPEPVAVVGMAIMFKRDGVYRVTVDRGRCTVTLKNMVENARWIPCSERLPEKDGRYLVTCRNWGAWVVDWNIWHNEPKQSWVYEQGVIAWMPLPEPYEE